MSEQKRETCPSCNGAGWWEAECCNGAGGCSCGGEPVYMGLCNVCRGEGEVDMATCDVMANANTIRGLHFIGSGPDSMYHIWPNRGDY